MILFILYAAGLLGLYVLVLIGQAIVKSSKPKKK
jgi:hypothetical protein